MTIHRARGIHVLTGVVACLALIGVMVGTTESVRSAITENPCNLPVSYSIGAIDSRFGLEPATVRHAMRDAAAIWEAGTGDAIFFEHQRGNGEADLLVTLVYDRRQQAADARRSAASGLEQARADLEQRQATHDAAIAGLDRDSAHFSEKRRDLERLAADYEQRVQAWNDRRTEHTADNHRALEAARTELNAAQQQFEQQRLQLNERSRALNAAAALLQRETDTLNRRIAEYNQAAEALSGFEVATYAEHGSERTITVYRLDDPSELTLVLAHELGHALGIDHVDSASAIMASSLSAANRGRMTLSALDLAALERTCSR